MSLQSKQQLAEEIQSDLQPLSRRKFLVRTVQAGMLVGLGGVAACSQSPETRSTEYLDADLVAFFQRFAQVLLPTEATKLTPVSQVPLIENLDTVFSYMPEKVRSDLSVAVKIFEMGGYVLGGHFSRFTNMTDRKAVEYIDNWQAGHHMQQGIVTVLKKLVYASYWQDESTWPPLEFDGPVSDKWGLKPLGETPLPEA